MTHKLSLALALTGCLLAGCVATSTNKAIVKEEPRQGPPSAGPHSEVAKVIPAPSKETIPSYTVTQKSPGKVVSQPSKVIGKATKTAASGTGKTTQKVVQDRKPPHDTGPKASSPESGKSYQDRISEFLASLEKTTYAFNLPSPIVVEKPTTIYLLLEPQGDASRLMERIKELAPHNASRVVHGETKWASVMEASLSGGDFDIEPTTPARNTLNPSGRATWSWTITPKHPGEKLPLILTTKAVLPSDLAPPYDVVLLQREIDVQVTTRSRFNHYFDKYWKWLLAGLAIFAIGIVGWWRKERRTAPDPAPKHKEENSVPDPVIKRKESSPAPSPALKRPPRKRSPRKRTAVLPKR